MKKLTLFLLFPVIGGGAQAETLSGTLCTDAEPVVCFFVTGTSATCSHSFDLSKACNSQYLGVL